MKPSNLIAVTGRVKTYLESPEKGTMPVSCTVYEYDNDLFAAMKYVDIALRGGAGINVILDKFTSHKPVDNDAVRNWKFYIDESHVDSKNIPVHLKERLLPFKDLGREYKHIYVNDSMEESTYKLMTDFYSIQESWSRFYICLISGMVPVINLTWLRPAGSTNNKGLVASGPTSFLGVYEAIAEYVRMGDIKLLMNVFGAMNEVLRRGGVLKNGIVTFDLDYRHPDIIKYLNIPLNELKGSTKKGIRVNEGIVDSDRLMNLVTLRINDKSLMLAKIQADGTFTQVCREIKIYDHDTCLLLHGNLGQVESFEQIPQMMCEAVGLGISILDTWERHPQYLSRDSGDRQIGVGFIGLANLLARFGIKYKEFVECLEIYLGIEERGVDLLNYENKAFDLCAAFVDGYSQSSAIAKEANLDRAFTCAPTQTCAYNHTDLGGNTTCKNINPPLKRRVQRQSQVVGSMNKWYFHGKVETMAEFLESMPIDPVTGKDGVQRLWEAWQTMMDATGLAHTMSFDLYRKVDTAWLKDFILNSPLQTTYYMFADQIDQSYLNKGVALTASDVEQCALDNPEGCVACAE